MNTVIAFIVIFGALVFFHELGHLVFAKRAGMLCREFAIGFGPKVFSFFKNETLYTIRLLPLGGFVRVAGEDPEMVDVKPGHHIALDFDQAGNVTKIIMNNKTKYPNAKMFEVERADLIHNLSISGYEPGSEELLTFPIHEKAKIVSDEQSVQIAPYNRQFASKTLWERWIQIFAGPLMNFLLAFVIFVILGILQGIPTDDPKLGQLTETGPAQQSGLMENDRVIAIDGEEVNSWQEIVAIIQQNPNNELDFNIERNGQQMTIPVTPGVREVENQQQGIIGVYPPVDQSVFGSVIYGATETWHWTKMIVVSLGKLITGEFSIEQLSGPVGIYSLTDQVAETGIYSLMRWAALLSINLGIVNLLPLPALDGGRLMFLLVEGVRGKPIDPQKEGLVHFVGFALLMLLMIVVTWNDIQRFFLQ